MDLFLAQGIGDFNHWYIIAVCTTQDIAKKMIKKEVGDKKLIPFENSDLEFTTREGSDIEYRILPIKTDKTIHVA